MSREGWRSLPGAVGARIVPTVFLLLQIGGLGLLSLGSAHFSIIEGDPVAAFVCLGGMFFLALEAADLWMEICR